jgi:hypothetical protein
MATSLVAFTLLGGHVAVVEKPNVLFIARDDTNDGWKSILIRTRLGYRAGAMLLAMVWSASAAVAAERWIARSGTGDYDIGTYEENKHV